MPKTTTATSAATLSIPGRVRLNREMALLHTDPPPGVSACRFSKLNVLRAEIRTPPFEDLPEGKGTAVFCVLVEITPRYPFEPPRCRLVTPVFHPNIDEVGRICLDTLRCPPTGSWSPAVSLPSLLLSLRSLLAEPNADDGLVAEASEMYRRDPASWRTEARLRASRDATAEKAAGWLKGNDDGDDAVRPLSTPSTEDKSRRTKIAATRKVETLATGKRLIDNDVKEDRSMISFKRRRSDAE